MRQVNQYGNQLLKLFKVYFVNSIKLTRNTMYYFVSILLQISEQRIPIFALALRGS